eukprot:CAMPEP_0196129894 /NCGR_PEP_ID=MMETSP0910-20130528/453_1 /TAXON_ID=49265 /ORGANISM="Thalassiosira rotula, Strain GSO102" /LENGTH=219 /DNA_ID=CAMNT_0041389093 /DNA_START=92 /DNA_END=751 /DNA_ORIENTATION=+
MNETDEQLLFPFKLYTMLEYASDSSYSSAVSWSSDGRSFAIYNTNIFMQHVVPRNFKLTKFRSFTRQLNNWGFTNLYENVWRHKYFIRGNTDGLQLLRRVQIKEPSKRKIPENSAQNKDQPNEENFSASRGQYLPLGAMEYCPRIDNENIIYSRKSQPYTKQPRSLPLERKFSANQPDKDDYLLLMCNILELDDNMFAGCRCSFCLANDDIESMMIKSG